LAVYEDYALTAANRASLGNKTTPPTSGPWAIELSSGGEATSSKLVALSGPDGLLVLATEGAESHTTGATPNQRATQLASICVSSSNLTASTRFYTEALGLQSFDDPRLAARLPANSASQAVAFGSKDNANPQIVVTSFDPPQSAQQLPTSMAVGQLGFNLINMRCDDLDELQKRIDALGIKPITEPAHVGMPFGYPGRVMIVAGPNGELFEFDEIVV
jgi:catechol 2,3-dioxygenase-like lactoylglutathione lyase family enzyme